MAKRVKAFKNSDTDTTPRRYPWVEWMDGSIWEIRQGEDYDVPTENMRVNLHERGKRYAHVVKTEKFTDGKGEGLRFQFRSAPRQSPIQKGPIGRGGWRPL